MASEISVIANLSAAKGNFSFPKIGKTHAIDMALAAGGVPGMVDATNAANGVNVPVTGITTLGWCYMRNLDDAATVDYGVVVAGALHVLGTMKPDEPALFRLKPGITFAVKSSIATSKVQVLVLND